MSITRLILATAPQISQHNMSVSADFYAQKFQETKADNVRFAFVAVKRMYSVSHGKTQNTFNSNY